MNFIIGVLVSILGASPYPVWQQVYDGGKTDMCHGVCLDSADHIRLIGETNQALDYDCWMIVVSKSGDSLWSLLYDDGGDEKGKSIATTREGNIAIAISFDQAALQTILYTQAGDFLWKRENHAEEIVKIIATTDDKIYVLAWYAYLDEYRIIIIGCNEEGETVLTIIIPGGNPGVSDLVVDPLGYIYIGSYKGGPCALWKYSPEGDLEWWSEYGNNATRGFALAINDADHLFQAGDIAVGSTVDFLLLKWDTLGHLIWDPGKNYDLGEDEYCRDIKLDAISDCYLAGWQIRGSEKDPALVKTDSAGNMLWAWVDTLEGDQEIEGIEVDEEGYIYLAGSHHNGENWDMLVMKVCQPLTITGRVTDSTGAPMEGIPVALSGDTTVEILTDTGGYYLIEVYNGGEYTVSPNLPGWSFTPSSYQYAPLAHREFDQDFEGRWTGIEESPLDLVFDLQVTNKRVLYSVPYATHVKIGVYDIVGRLVLEVVDEEVKPGRHCFEWKGRDHASRTVASGVYFVKMTTEEYKKTHKMVILE